MASVVRRVKSKKTHPTYVIPVAPAPLVDPMIGKRLRDFRLARGWRQEDLGFASGVSSSNISKIENGNSSPSIGTLMSLANALGIPINALTGSAEATEAERDASFASLLTGLPPSQAAEFFAQIRALTARQRAVVRSLIALLLEPRSDVEDVPSFDLYEVLEGSDPSGLWGLGRRDSASLDKESDVGQS